MLKTFEVVLDLFYRRAYYADGVLKILVRHAKALFPIRHLVRLVHVDASFVAVISLFRPLAHRYSSGTMVACYPPPSCLGPPASRLPARMRNSLVSRCGQGNNELLLAVGCARVVHAVMVSKAFNQGRCPRHRSPNLPPVNLTGGRGQDVAT